MTFNIADLISIGGQSSDQSGGDAYSYNAGTDNIHDCLTDNFFLDAFKNFNIGDSLDINHGGGVSTFRVTAATESLVTLSCVSFGGGQSALVADPGQALGGLLITSKVWIIETVATIGDSTTLPPATPGIVIFLKNDAANACEVFPSSGDSINASAPNASVTLNGGVAVEIVCGDFDRWLTI